MEWTIELPRIRLKVYPNDSVHLLFFITFNRPESGAFSRDFTINVSPQCRVFTRALHLQICDPLSPSACGQKFQIIGALVVSYFYSLTL